MSKLQVDLRIGQRVQHEPGSSHSRIGHVRARKPKATRAFHGARRRVGPLRHAGSRVVGNYGAVATDHRQGLSVWAHKGAVPFPNGAPCGRPSFCEHVGGREIAMDNRRAARQKNKQGRGRSVSWIHHRFSNSSMF